MKNLEMPSRKFETLQNYNPEDPYQARLWELNGSPDLETGWLPTIILELQEDGETYERVPIVVEPTLTDVEIAIRQATGNFEQARLAAPKALDRLKGTVHTALVSGGMSSDEATAAGVGLVLMHGPVLAAFEAAGGHPKAAEALYNAIASKPSTDALPWLSKGILEVFAAFLVPK